MKTSILTTKFDSFTSYSLVINNRKTNFWDTDRNIVEQFKIIFDNSSELQSIAKDSLKEYNSFDICSFIDPSYLKDLPIEIINIYDVCEYWDIEKLIGYENIVEVFSVSGYPSDRDKFSKDFVLSELLNRSFTQLNRLYDKTGRRAKKLICFVFNYGYHISTIF